MAKIEKFALRIQRSCKEAADDIHLDSGRPQGFPWWGDENPKSPQKLPKTLSFLRSFKQFFEIPLFPRRFLPIRPPPKKYFTLENPGTIFPSSSLGTDGIFS